MPNIDLISLIKEDKLIINVKERMTFALRLFWVILFCAVIVTIVNLLFGQQLVISLSITLLTIFLFILSVIRRKRKNDFIKNRYPYAYETIVESYGIIMKKDKSIPLVDIYQLSGYDEKVFLCIEEMHKYQLDNQYPIAPRLYRKNYYSQDALDNVWGLIMSYISKIEGQDVDYTKDQIGMLCDKYKIWSEISKRILHKEDLNDIYNDESLNSQYKDQFREMLGKTAVGYIKTHNKYNDLSTQEYIKESEWENIELYYKFFEYPQAVHTLISKYISMKNGDVDYNEDYNKRYRGLQKVFSSISKYIIGIAIIVGGILAWSKTSTFSVGIVSAIGVGIVCMLLYMLYRYILDKNLISTFKENPTIMASIVTMEGMNPERVLHDVGYLKESDIWKLLLVDRDLFRYSPLVIKPIRNNFVSLLENYPNGVQKALESIAKEAQYSKLLIRERYDKKEKHKETIKAQDLLYNLLDETTFEIVRKIISSKEDIIKLERTFSSAISNDELKETELIEKKGLRITKKWIHIKANSKVEDFSKLTEDERYWDGPNYCPLIFPGRFSSVLDCLKESDIPLETITKLKISGTINSVDIRVLRELSGIGSHLSYCWEYYEGEPLHFDRFDNHLIALDLSEAEIVSNQWYRSIDSYDKHGCWSMGIFGDKEFSDYCHPYELDDWFIGARALKHIVLPQKIQKINSVPTIQNLYAYAGSELLNNEIWKEFGIEKPEIREISQLTYEENNVIYIDADRLIKEKTIYYDGVEWEVKGEVSLDAEDKAMFSSAKVVSSEFGKSICFFLNIGGCQYVPMSNQGEQFAVGDTVSLDAITIQVLGRIGEKDIMRAKINANTPVKMNNSIGINRIQMKTTNNNDMENTTPHSISRKTILFFDTETTGIPLNYKAPSSDTNNWPRLVQLAWILTDEDGNRIHTGNLIIKPNGFAIPADATKVHGITTQRAKEEGVPLAEAIEQFKANLDVVTYIVGHNIEFDKKIVGAEMIRLGMKDELEKKKSYCTMQSSIDFCKIPGKYGYKYPKLQELYRKLFGEDFEDAHNAMCDIEATEKCFWELRNRKLI